jgi:hypothetical protein
MSLYWIADRLAPRARKQFLKATLKLRGRITIEGLVYGRGVSQAFDLYRTDLQGSVAKTLNLVWERSAVAAEKEIAARIGARFDIINPAAVEAAELRSSQLIREISAKTRAAIQQTMGRALSQGIPVRDLAKQIKPMIGLLSRDQGAVINYRASLRAAGTPAARARQLAQKYADKLLTTRSVTIARTETIRASVWGEQDVWRQARRDGLIDESARQVWIVANDERLCPICAALDGQSVPIDESFEMAFGERITGPTAHPRCRCSLSLVFGR